jgi:hypothetical protein
MSPSSAFSTTLRAIALASPSSSASTLSGALAGFRFCRARMGVLAVFSLFFHSARAKQRHATGELKTGFALGCS